MAPSPDLSELPDQAPLTAATARQNLVQLIQLRWIAVAGQLVTIAVVQWGLHIDLPLGAMALVLVIFVAANIASLQRLRWPRPITNRELFFGLTFDAVVLTSLLFLSGGPTNPFTSLYLLQVILGAVLLEAWAVWAMVGVALAGFIGLTFAYQPLVLPPHGPPLLTLYIAGALIGFALDAVLLVVFIGRINRNLRQRDARLAELRQTAAEEDHIVRMGLLASGAAHELGTPLGTLDVILGDWRRLPAVTRDPELAQDVEVMRAEVARCKAIVTGVLASAGEARAEAAGVSGLKAWLKDVFDDWAAYHPAGVALYDDGLASDPVVVADSALRQAITNLLENAFEASPEAIWMKTQLIDGTLRIRIQDAGPGFPPEALAEIGKPYQSTKQRLGSGLGLFLVVNVVRKLGGRLEARNRPTGGAEVSVTLPISALTVREAA